MPGDVAVFLIARPGDTIPQPLLEGLSQYANVIQGSTVEELHAAIDDVDVIVVWGGVNMRQMLETVDPFPPRLRWISQAGIGVDKLLFHRLIESDILVTNMRGVSNYPHAMAEFAFAAIMLFGKQLLTIEQNRQIRRWERVSHALLQNQTVGVIGLGSIGKEVARRALGFGMTVLATKRNPNSDAMPGVELYAPSEIDVVLFRSDYVVLAAPLTDETRSLIGPGEINRMKPGAVLVNVARGAMVDQQALIDALNSGHLAGAALDVFTEEPLPESSPLWDAPNLFISPHMSAYVHADSGPGIAAIVENMRRFSAGEPLQRVVDKRLGY